MRWLAEDTPGSAEPLRLMDATPIGCGQSKTTAQRSNLFGWAGYGYESAHSRWYWGVKLLLLTPRTAPSPGSVWPTRNWSVNASRPARS